MKLVSYGIFIKGEFITFLHRFVSSSSLIHVVMNLLALEKAKHQFRAFFYLNAL